MLNLEMIDLLLLSIFYLILFVCCPGEAYSFLMKDTNGRETEERGAGDEPKSRGQGN